MALGRGESVGEAYIRIHADGSRLPQEIRDEFDSQKEQFEDAGRERGEAEEKAYSDAKKKHRDRDNKVTQKEISESIEKDRGKRRALEEYLAGREGKAIRNGLRKELSKGGGKSGGKELADRIFTDLADRARKTNSTKLFGNLFKPLKFTDITQAADEDDENFLRRRAAHREDFLRAQAKREEAQSILLGQLRRKALADIKADEAKQSKLDDEARRARNAAVDKSISDQRARYTKLQSVIEGYYKKADEDRRLFERDENRAYAENKKRNDSRVDRSLADQKARQDKLRNLIETHYRQQDKDREAFIRREAQSVRKLALLDRQRNKINAGVFAGDVYHNRAYAESDRKRFNELYRQARLRAAETGDYRDINRLLRDRQVILDQYNAKLIRGNGLLRGGRRETTELERSMNRAGKRVDEFTDRLEGGNRRGNIFTRILRAMTTGLLALGTRKVFTGLQRVVRGIGNVTDIINGPGTLAQKRARLLSLAINTIGNGLRKFSASIARGFAGMTVFFSILGPVAALLSMLAGAVVALSSTIIVGLVGALGAVIPLLGVAAIAGGVLALALVKASDAEKKALKIKFAPIRKDLNDLQTVARRGLFGNLDNQIPKVGARLRQLRPLIAGVSQSLSRGGTTFLDALGGKDQARNLDTFRTAFPRAIDKLSHTFADLFIGIQSYFRALLPTTDKFLNSLQTGASNFRTFASSTKGQNRIKDYMDRAWKSTKILGDTIRLIYRVLRDLTTAGNDVGDSLFGSINKSLAEYDRYLTSGRGRRETRRFFNDVKNFAGALGRFVGGVAKFFGGLDDETSRSSLNNILTVVGEIGNTIGDALPIISTFTRALADVLSQLSGPIGDLFTNLQPLIRSVSRSFSTILVPAVDAVVTAISPFIIVLAGIAKFLSDHADIFGPLLASFLAFKAAVIVADFGSLIAGRIANFALYIQGAASRGAITIRGATARLGAAVSGLALILGANALGSSVGGAGGKAITILGSAGGGALAGSAFGGIGALVGGVVGGVAGIITAFNQSGDAAQRAGDKAKASLAEQRQAANDLASALQQTRGEYDKTYKGAVVNQLNKDGLLGRANARGIDVKGVADAALGDKDALRALQARAGALQQRQFAGTITRNAQGYPMGISPGRPLTAKERTQLATYLVLLKRINAEIPKARGGELSYQALRKALGDSVVPSRQLAGGLKNISKEIQGKSLDRFTAQGARNTVVIGENVDRLNKLAEAQKKAKVPADQIGVTYASNTEKLRKQLEQLGLQPDAIDKVIRETAKVPKGVNIKFATPGAAVSAGLAVELRGKLAAIPKNVQTAITAHNLSPNVIRDLTKDLGHVPTRKDIALYLRRIGVDPRKTKAELDALKDKRINIIIQQNVKRRILARGGLATHATDALIGEAGPEAVVPLRRNLSQVDPSVRALSAFAQGIPLPGSSNKPAAGGAASVGKSINFGPGAIVINSTTDDPLAAAHEVVNYLAARAGIGA